MPDTPQRESPDTVIVAGASSGIGRATAQAIAASGRRVMLFARRHKQLAEGVDQLRNAGGCAEFVVGDATDRAAIDEAVRFAADGSRLVALVNCVGMNIPRRSLRELDADTWSTMLRVNLDSAYLLTQAVLPIFRDQHDGLLVHVASRSVFHPDASGPSYQAAKAGVTALAHATAIEEQGNGIRVSVVYPGMTDTPLVRQRPVPPTDDELARALQPEDVARVVGLLLELPTRAHIPDVSIYPTN